MEQPGFLRRVGMVAAASFLLNTAEAQTPQQNQGPASITNMHVESRRDQNMPEGFRREQVMGKTNGQEKAVASLFWFEEGKTQAHFISNDLHPESFTPNIDYKKIDEIATQKGTNGVISFAGAYKSQSGNIEGVAP